MKCQKDKFILDPNVRYITTASHSLCLKARETAVIKAVKEASKPWLFSSNGMKMRNELREKMSKILGCTPSDVAWVSSTSYAVSLAVHNLIKLNKVGPESTIIILKEQFWSNVYAWQQLAKTSKCKMVLASPDTEDILQIMKETSHPIVALPTVLWANGAKLDLVSISKECKKLKGLLFVDATQTLGVEVIDLKAIDPDFLCASVYKWLLGSLPGAILYASSKWQKEGVPLVYHQNNTEKFGGGIKDIARLKIAFDPAPKVKHDYYSSKLIETAQRFEIGGNPDIVSICGFAASLNQILAWEVKQIELYVKKLTNSVAEFFDQLNDTIGREVYVYPKIRSCNIIGVRNVEDKEFADNLVGYLKKNNIYVVARCGYVRFSPYLHNDNDDFNVLFNTINKFLSS